MLYTVVSLWFEFHNLWCVLSASLLSFLICLLNLPNKFATVARGLGRSVELLPFFFIWILYFISSIKFSITKQQIGSLLNLTGCGVRFSFQHIPVLVLKMSCHPLQIAHPQPSTSESIVFSVHAWRRIPINLAHTCFWNGPKISIHLFILQAGPLLNVN